MAQAMPLFERFTFNRFCVASSPWKSRSPILTCSMKSSSKALSWAGVCFSRCASAPLGSATSTTSKPTMAAARTARRVIVIRVSLSLDSASRSRAGARSLVGAIVGPDLVGDSRAEDLVVVVPTAGIPWRLTDHVLAPHDVLVVDRALGVHRQARPADAVVGITGIHARLAGAERWHALRRIRPGPGRGEHADGPHLADLVVEDLVYVAVDVRDVAERLEDLVDVAPVAHPEVPGRVVLPERIVAEEDDGLVLRPVGERAIQPGELIPADAGPGAGDTPVEDRHVAHAFLGRHLLDGPEVGGPAHGVEADEAHALVVHGPRLMAVELLPRHAHVEVPVVLAGDVDLLDLHLFEDLGAELELDRVPELPDVTADDEEVGWRRHRLDFLDGADGGVDEAGVDGLGVEVRVRDPGELDLRCPEGEVHGVDEREPAVRAEAEARTGDERAVQERAPCDRQRGRRSFTVAVEDLMHLPPCL